MCDPMLTDAHCLIKLAYDTVYTIVKGLKPRFTLFLMRFKADLDDFCPGKKKKKKNNAPARIRTDVQLGQYV
jgi:hypothetical protein